MNHFKRLLHFSLNTVNIGLILCLLVSISVSYIRPTLIDFLPLVGLAFMPLFLLTSLFLFRRSIYRTNLFWTNVMVVLFSLLFAGRFIQFSIPNKKMQKDLRILSYNVRSFNLADWNPDKKTAQNIFDLISTQSPDIVCIQEFAYDPKKKLNAIAEFKKLGYKFHFPYFNPKYVTYGNAIFSRYPILTPSPNLDNNSLDFNQVVDIKIHLDTIRLINNHLWSVQLTSMKTKTEFGIDEIDSVAKKLKTAFDGRSMQTKWLEYEISTAPHPLIICGDFNDTPMSYTYHRLSRKLYDAFMEKGRGIGASFWIKCIPLRIDYFMHSKDIKTQSFKTLPVGYSDHRPIVMDFSIKRPKK